MTNSFQLVKMDGMPSLPSPTLYVECRSFALSLNKNGKVWNSVNRSRQRQHNIHTVRAHEFIWIFRLRFRTKMMTTTSTHTKYIYLLYNFDMIISRTFHIIQTHVFQIFLIFSGIRNAFVCAPHYFLFYSPPNFLRFVTLCRVCVLFFFCYGV